jgi:putative transposase
MLNAVLYVARTGCAWRMLPHDLPPFTSVYTFFRRLQRKGTWERLNDALRAKVRQRAGREVETTLIIVDSQSVKTSEKGG